MFARCASATSGSLFCVRTAIPGATVIVQDVASFGCPSTRT